MNILIEESYITKLEYGFDYHDIEIIDTAGQEEFMSFRDSSLSKGDAFLGLFAVDSNLSWHDLTKLRSKVIREHEGDDQIPLVIIASKCVSAVFNMNNEIHIFNLCHVPKC